MEKYIFKVGKHYTFQLKNGSYLQGELLLITKGNLLVIGNSDLPNVICQADIIKFRIIRNFISLKDIIAKLELI